ncbi:hypothetical protein BMS3Bbin15_00601 [archaeon BMS3Bbin15]|nr:hypothetical protein BMS3Bbin15_00601 [archaeon BMS3Bbin15]
MFNKRIKKIERKSIGGVRMIKLQKTTKGAYFIILPRDIIRIAGWKEGDEIDVRLGSDISPGSRDLVLLKK